VHETTGNPLQEILSGEAFIILVEALRFNLKLATTKKGYFTRRFMCIFVSTGHVTCEILIRAKIFVMAFANINGTRIYYRIQFLS
jgi:hypothetical protein